MLYILLAANIGVFAVMYAVTGHMEWSAGRLLDWGGNYGVYTLHGQPWRLVSSQYLHENAQHILGNMMLLFITGRFLSEKLNPFWFFGLYTLCGVVAALASAAYHPNVVGIGASGAIAGLVGIVVAFWVSRRFPEISGAWVLQTVGINAVFSYFVPHVDWMAHLAGFVMGLLCGAALLAFRLGGARRLLNDDVA